MNDWKDNGLIVAAKIAGTVFVVVGVVLFTLAGISLLLSLFSS